MNEKKEQYNQPNTRTKTGRQREGWEGEGMLEESTTMKRKTEDKQNRHREK